MLVEAGDDVGASDTLLDVLLVDDEESAHNVVRQCLPNAHLRGAYNLDQATAAIRERQPAVVILDLNLPTGSGLRLLASGVVSCACVVLTAYPSMKSAVEAYQLGALDCVEKTAENFASLSAVVQSAIERHHSHAWWATELAALVRDLDAARITPVRYQRARRRFDSILARLALQQSGQNKRAAARMLGITHQTFYGRLDER